MSPPSEFCHILFNALVWRLKNLERRFWLATNEAVDTGKLTEEEKFVLLSRVLTFRIQEFSKAKVLLCQVKSILQIVVCI